MGIIFLKIFVAVFIVVTLSLVAERLSPKVSGILAGYPLGTAIALFFYGYEIDPAFASNSAVYAILGLIASQLFVYTYYQTSRYLSRFSVFLSSILSFAVYLGAACLLRMFELSETVIILLTLTATIAFIFLFRHIQDAVIDTRVKFSYKVLLARAGMAATVYLFGLFIYITKSDSVTTQIED